MNPWFVVASVVEILMAPMVARLVIITEPAGKSFAELFFRPSSLILKPESNTKADRARVRSVGVNHCRSPSVQYASTAFEGVPPPTVSVTSHTRETSHPLWDWTEIGVHQLHTLMPRVPEVYEPLPIQQPSHLLQNPNPPTIVLDQIIQGAEGCANCLLGCDRR